MCVCVCAQYVKMNKEADNDWFTIESNKTGTRYVSSHVRSRSHQCKHSPECVCCTLDLTTCNGAWGCLTHAHRWTGKCWSFHNGLRYEFDLEFEVRRACHSMRGARLVHASLTPSPSL